MPVISKYSFGLALEAIKIHSQRGMRLPFWSPEVIVRVQEPDLNSKMTAPYLYVTSRYGLVPWNPTQPELFNQNWEVHTLE
jgi:hypothetical protein